MDNETFITRKLMETAEDAEKFLSDRFGMIVEDGQDRARDRKEAEETARLEKIGEDIAGHRLQPLTFHEVT